MLFSTTMLWDKFQFDDEQLKAARDTWKTHACVVHVELKYLLKASKAQVRASNQNRPLYCNSYESHHQYRYVGLLGWAMTETCIFRWTVSPKDSDMS